MKTACAILFLVPFFTQADPPQWFERESIRTPTVITHGNGTWWSVFDDGHYTSANGINWTKRSESESRLKPQFFRGEFYYLSERVLASSNSWSDVRNVGAPFDGAGPLEGFVIGNEQFYAVGFNQIAISPDGSDWTHTPLPGLNGTIKLMAAGQGAVLLATTATYIYSSADGQNWSSVYLGVSLADLKATSSGFLALEYFRLPDESFATRLYQSNDGSDWRVVHEKPGLADRILVGPDSAVVWGLDILATVDLDGRNWTDITRPSHKAIRDIAYGDGRYLGVLWPNGFISSFPFNIPHIRSITKAGSTVRLQTESAENSIVESTERLGTTWSVVSNITRNAGAIEFQGLSTESAFFRLKAASP